MIVTETNSGGGAPSAIRQESGTIQFHTAASGTADADFDSEKVRITSAGNVGINDNNPNARLVVAKRKNRPFPLVVYPICHSSTQKGL